MWEPIPRKKMPQIRSHSMDRFLGWLRQDGVVVTTSSQFATYNASQIEVVLVDNLAAVASRSANLDKPILVSEDGFIADGHHRHEVCRQLNRQVVVNRVKLPMGSLVERMHVFNALHPESMEYSGV